MLYVATNSVQLWNFEQLSEIDSVEIDCRDIATIDLFFQINVAGSGGAAISTRTVTIKALDPQGMTSVISPSRLSVGGGAALSGATVVLSVSGTPPLAVFGMVTIVNPPPKLVLIPSGGGGFPTSGGTGSFWKATAAWR